ncbi:MAG: arsenite methyltransferase [Chlorobaculum sp.]|nr:arsenite methyltransferase [Chlorobaculum sp.]
MKTKENNGILDAIKTMYASVVTHNSPCGCTSPVSNREMSGLYGYTERELDSIPQEANLGLGCGNPLAYAGIKPGDTVLDLGSGAGMDAFIASPLVGETGLVIGVDMTPEMIERARLNATRNGYGNVDFRLGRIEELPVDDASVDLVTSNCVINLSTDKPQVFREAFRVLKPGGRLMVSDIVLLGKIPEKMLASIDAYVRCLSGAIQKDEYVAAIQKAGFEEITILGETIFPVEMALNHPGLKEAAEQMNIPMEELEKMAGSVASIKVSAKKPEKR